MSDPDDSSSADERAREVVALYGDPASTWGIGLDCGFVGPGDRDPATVLRELARNHPHLGAPELHEVHEEQWAAERHALVSAPYPAGGAVLRVAVTPDARRVLVAAHHGVLDGLGMVAVAGALRGVAPVAGARGIGERAAARSFVAQSARRALEAVLRPPPHFAPSGPTAPSGDGEHLLVKDLGPLRCDTAALGTAVVEAFRARGGRGRPLLFVGASRRPAGVVEPDRRTAYLRVRVAPGTGEESLRAAVRSGTPEPDFPETSWRGLGPRVTRVLRRRLGATAAVSNLGVLTADGLASVTLFPAVSGPRAVVVGLASTPTTTTLSLRARADELTPADAEDILRRIGGRLVSRGR